VRRAVLAVVILGALELASFGTVLAISNVQPAIARADAPAAPNKDCVPYWLVMASVRCPSG
jgi:hypothetical protein